MRQNKIPPPIGPRLAYTEAEAANLVGLSLRSLRYLRQQGRLGYSKIGRRIVIPHTELERLLRRATVKATARLDADESIRPLRHQNGNAPEGCTPEASEADAADQAAPYDGDTSHGSTQPTCAQLQVPRL
jgi:excisionase family DNA binding protein